MHDAVYRLDGVAGRPGYWVKGQMLEVDGRAPRRLIEIQGPAGPFQVAAIRTHEDGYVEAFYSSCKSKLFFRYTMAPGPGEPFTVKRPSRYPMSLGSASLDPEVISEFRDNVRFLLETRISASLEVLLDTKTHDVVFVEGDQ